MIELEAKNLKKKFHSPLKLTVLDGVDLTVKKGETVAIVGKSGQGKSTLLQVLGTLDRFDSGDLSIGGKKVTFWNRPQIRNQNIGFVFQSFHLLDDLTSLQNVLMPAFINRDPIQKGSPAYFKGLELLNAVGLSERAHFKTKVLSGGEKQRVAIARALSNNPNLILADEPSGNLDKETAAEIHTLLLNFSKQKGKSLVVVTHDMDLAALMDTTYTLHNGLLTKN
jgi:lipoprotein-releasing system ATP-binding protein